MLVGDSSNLQIIAWSGVLILAVLLLFLAVSCLRRWVHRSDPADSGGVGFTLGDLREMHRRGELSDEQYQRARDKLIAKAQAGGPQRDAERK